MTRQLHAVQTLPRVHWNKLSPQGLEPREGHGIAMWGEYLMVYGGFTYKFVPNNCHFLTVLQWSNQSNVFLEHSYQQESTGAPQWRHTHICLRVWHDHNFKGQNFSLWSVSVLVEG